MSYLQAFNFSSPFSVPNFAGFPGLGGAAGLQQHRFAQTLSPAGTTFTRTASNHLLVNPSPQSPVAQQAANIPIPQSIVPNYSPNAQTDYYGNPNENFANQQAPIPPEYQQQQQHQQQQQAQQQFQQQLSQQRHQQLQHHLVQLRPQVVQPIPEGPVTPSTNGDGFDVIIQDPSTVNEEQSEPIDPEQQRQLQQDLLRQPPSQIPRSSRRRGKNRNPPRVVNYSPVEQVHYVPPAGLGPHHVSFDPKQKFSVHDVIEHHTGDNNTPLKITTSSDDDYLNVHIDSVGGPNNAPTNLLNNNNAPPAINNDNNDPLSVNNDATIINSAGLNNNNPGNAANLPAGNAALNNESILPPSSLSENSGSRRNIPNVENNVETNAAQPPISSSGSSQTPGSEPKHKKANEESHEKIRVTPIQGPIFAKDGHVPVVPLYSYNSVKNGTYYQIPILWTALSYALGLEVHGEIIRGLPCIKRLNQLYCPTAGQTYPIEKIEGFIDENKALIRRMYGDFIMSSEAYVGPPGGNVLRRSTRDIFEDEVPEMFPDSKHSTKKHHQTKRSPHHEKGHDEPNNLDLPSVAGNETLSAHIRATRQTVNNRNGNPSQQPRSNRVDSCESTVEIVTPYWAANSGGKVRAIVNTQHFEQAIHQEVCRHTSTRRCSGECGCEQKYKWHRLLAYDPDNDCRGIFMDWFLFPSCCVCRCNPQQSS